MGKFRFGVVIRLKLVLLVLDLDDVAAKVVKSLIFLQFGWEQVDIRHVLRLLLCCVGATFAMVVGVNLVKAVSFLILNRIFLCFF